MEEDKSISGDDFIIEMGGALFCVACDFVASQIDTIITHMKENHKVQFQGIINKGLTNQQTVPEKFIEKKSCVKKTLNEERYARNYNISNAPAPGTFPCGKCNIVCDGKTRYVKHMYEIHNRKLSLFNCDICGKKYFDKEGMQFHMSISHTEVQSEPKPSSIQMHEYSQNQYHHPSSVKSIQPNIYVASKHVQNIPSYNQIFPNQRNNLVVLPQALTFPCSYCNFTFQSPAQLMNHNALYHTQEGQFRDFSQTTEQFILNNQANTVRTINQENINLYQAFNTLMSTEPSSNKSVHAESYQVKSETRIIQTQESFITNTNINLDNQTMIKELSTVRKKIRVFTETYENRRYNLDATKLVKGKKQLECTACGESFGFYHTKYIKHMNKMHKSNIKPFCCTFCNYRCLRQARLRDHMQKHH